MHSAHIKSTYLKNLLSKSISCESKLKELHELLNIPYEETPVGGGDDSGQLNEDGIGTVEAAVGGERTGVGGEGIEGEETVEHEIREGEGGLEKKDSDGINERNAESTDVKVLKRNKSVETILEGLSGRKKKRGTKFDYSN